jgi:hypothetical protein
VNSTQSMTSTKLGNGHYLIGGGRFIVRRVSPKQLGETGPVQWQMFEAREDGTEGEWCQTFDTKAEAIEAAASIPPEVEPTVIQMQSADPYRATNYGVLLESVARYAVGGRGFHNPSFFHTIEVWINRNGLDPNNRPTETELTVLMSAQASVISQMPNRNIYGDEVLLMGDLVNLRLGDLDLGTYRIESRYLADPYLVKV